MFAKLTTVVVALSAFAAATDYQCNTGTAQCCNSVQSANSDAVTSLFSLLGLAIGSVTGQVGLGCSPISAVGLGSGANCVQQPVCCTGNQFNGLINVGCTPINAVV